MVLSQIAVPCDNPRIRKDFRQIDQEGKWNRVANAFAQMKSDGKLIEYTNKHFNESYHTHYTMEFLTWHRKMIWEMEDQLRAIGGDDLTLPYIDWAQDGDLHDGKIDRAVIFTPYFYGSTPTDKCASGRIYNSWNVPDSYGLGKCLTRTTDQHYLVDGWAATDILMLSTNFSDFLLSVENGIHDHVHERIGGAMPTMYSPIDPTFYGHHGFIDMLFVNFQHIQNSWTTFPIPSIANKSFKIFNENRTHNDVYQMKNMCVQYERYKPNNNKLKKRKDSQSYQNVTKLEYAKYNKQLASHYDKIKEYVKDNKKEEGLKAIAAFYGDTGFIAINDPPDPDMIHHMGMDPKLAAEITNRSNSARLELAKFGNFTVQGKAVPDTGNRARNIASSGCAVFFGLFVMLVMLVGTTLNLPLKSNISRHLVPFKSVMGQFARRTNLIIDEPETKFSVMASVKNDSKSNSEDNKKTQEDFEMNDVLGEGSYSTVFLAKEKATGKQYAIKVLDKRHIIKERKVKYVTIEKDVLNMCDHPFIIKLFYTFQDQNNLYFCLELCPGDLLKAIKIGGFSIEAVQFYAAEMIEAVNYLHTMRILHRDLKPENILLSDKNHIKLTDYGTAKILGRNEEESSETKTRSFVGTAEYVSPEVLSEKDSSEASDFWAIGCIMVQMITQKPPFKGPNDYQTFQKVSKLQYSLPLDFPDKVKQVTSKLIQLEPLNRATYAELIGLDFFKPLPFKDLYLKTPPAFYPIITAEKEETEGQDELGKFDAPKRKSRISFGALSKVSTKSSNNSNLSDSNVSETDPSKLLSNISDQSVLLISDFLKPEERIIKMGILYKKKGLVPRKRWFVLTDLPRFMYFKGNAMILKENSKYEQDVPPPVKVKKEKEKEKSDSDDSGEVIEQKTIGELTFKGLIPWTDEIDVEFKNKTTFLVNTPKRAYYLIDQSGNAETWCESIRTVKMLANPNTLHK